MSNYKLTSQDIKFLPKLGKFLKTINNKKLAVSANEIQELYRNHFGEGNRGATVRQLIHELRVTKKVPGLIATAKGYYSTSDEKELKAYKKALKRRINSIEEVYHSL